MARRCDLTDKSSQSGNNVSHAENKSRRSFKVNIQHVTVVSDILNQNFRMKLAVNTLRSIEHNGGLDMFLATASDRNLSEEGIKLKRKIKKALVAADKAPKPTGKRIASPAAAKKATAAKKAA